MLLLCIDCLGLIYVKLLFYMTWCYFALHFNDKVVSYKNIFDKL